jgi:hypothetical protein
VWGGGVDGRPLPITQGRGEVHLSLLKFKTVGGKHYTLTTLRYQEGDRMRVRVMGRATWKAGHREDGHWTELKWDKDYVRTGTGRGKRGRWNLREVNATVNGKESAYPSRASIPPSTPL